MGLSASQARFLQLTARKSDIEYEAQQICFQRLSIAEKQEAASMKYQDAVNNRKLTFNYNNGQGLQKVDLTYNNYKNYMNQQMDGLATAEQKYYLVSSSGNKIIVSSEAERDAMMKKDSYPVANKNDIDEAKAKYDATEDKSTLDADTLRLAQMDLSSCVLETRIDEETGEEIHEYVHYKFSEDDFMIVEDLDNPDVFQSAIEDGVYFFATIDTDKETGEHKFKTQSFETLGGGGKISQELDKSDDAKAEAEYQTEMARLQKIDQKLELRLDQLETTRNAVQTEMESVQKVLEDNIEKSFNSFG